MTDKTLSKRNFDQLRSLLLDKAGLLFAEDKLYLFQSRLGTIAKKQKFDSIDSLALQMLKPGNSQMIDLLIDAMTTNETSFFRDNGLFEEIKREILPGLTDANRASKRLNIWCAACSSGQEPYSLAILIHEFFPELVRDWNVKILATDLSNGILAQAKSGLYSQLEVNRGLPASYLIKYFSRQGMQWQINDNLRSMIEFNTCNLVGNWPRMPELDMIFLRNVLIYFKDETKQQILNNMSRVIKPNGRLFLGAAESLLRLSTPFSVEAINKIHCYRLNR